MVFLVFPTPLLISSKLFQVSQTSQDVCRIDGEHLLSSLLVWSGHPPPISYPRHTKPSKHILLFYLKILDSIWEYSNGCMIAMWVTVAPLPPLFHIFTILLFWWMHLYAFLLYSMYISSILLNKKCDCFFSCRKGKWNENLNAVETHQKCMSKLVCMPISQSDESDNCILISISKSEHSDNSN